MTWRFVEIFFVICAPDFLTPNIRNPPSLKLRRTKGEMQEWFNWHAWKACVPQKGTGGSNPFLSAKLK
jgi:hypothetical protein